MKTHFHISALFLSSIITSNAAIIWTGGAGAGNPGIFNGANWDFDGSSLDSISGGNAVGDDVIINGSAFTINVTDAFWLAQNRTFTATNATFGTSNNNGNFRSTGSSSGQVAAENQAVFNLINSSATLNRIGTNTTVYLDENSSLSLTDTTYDGINTYSSIYLAPGASITFVNGNGAGGGNASLAIAQRIINPISGVSFFEDYYAGANGTPASGAEFNDELYYGQGPQVWFELTGSDLTPFGQANTENPNATFTITAIPESGAFALSLIGASLLVLPRRRRHAV